MDKKEKECDPILNTLMDGLKKEMSYLGNINKLINQKLDHIYKIDCLEKEKEEVIEPADFCEELNLFLQNFRNQNLQFEYTYKRLSDLIK